MKRNSLKIEKRTIKGRKVKALRKKGVLPANIYGKKVKSRSVKIGTSDFDSLFSKVGETTLIDLILGKEEIPVLINNVQVDPVTDMPIHVDFLQVNLKEKVSAQVPLELVGVSPAVKQGLGTIVQHMDEVEVEALPTDLPDKFEIDISKLQDVDASIRIKDLDVYAKKVQVKEDEERILVLVEALRKEEEEEVKPVEEDVEEEGVDEQEEEEQKDTDEEPSKE